MSYDPSHLIQAVGYAALAVFLAVHIAVTW